MIEKSLIKKKSLLKNECIGLITNIQRFSIHDGPGIRTTVFMKGCPLKCHWCCNPETHNQYPEIIFLEMKCINCGNCIKVCPRGAISFAGQSITIEWEKCDQCQKCAEVCKSGAIETTGKYFSCERLMKEILSDRLFYEESGGGVTFSGGEPLVQWEFVLKMLKECKYRSIHTCLDTTGYVSWEILAKIIPYVDIFLYDLKHLNPLPHQAKTGVNNTQILENLSKLAGLSKVWLRIPLIPEYNDSKDHLIKVGHLAVDLEVERVSLMPYHSWGAPKYARQGSIYRLSGLMSPAKEDMEKYKEILEEIGVKTSIGR